MPYVDRRAFLKAGSAALTTLTTLSARPAFALSLSGDDFRVLAEVALDAARSSGAEYADVNIRITRTERWISFSNAGSTLPMHASVAGFGVRSLVGGHWGFAALDGLISRDNAAQLGRDSAAQAKILNRSKPLSMTLAPLMKSANGVWNMPVEIDPFSVSYEEKVDFFSMMSEYLQRYKYGVTGVTSARFVRDERTFASSDGAFTTQTVFLTQGSLNLGVSGDWQSEQSGNRSADFLTTVGKGWEAIRANPFKDSADRLIEEALRSRRKKPVDVGRYDIVFDAQALAGIVSTTIGTATELDRAMGYEANNGGTSYINEPLEMLGTFKIGSPLLNVTANRSMAGGAATVKWDSEGVEPVETKLVKDGILNDFQTTRESASWISARSNGCAGQYTHHSPAANVNPNLVMAPGANSLSFEDMIKDTKKGLAVMGGYSDTDHQALNGTGKGEIVYEINNGKLGTAISGVQYLFRAPEFWKNLVAIGGAATQQEFGYSSSRFDGSSAFTVSAVPGKVTGLAVTDVMRKG